MLTVFTAPKAFRGHIGVIQRNAIRSWTMLKPACEVILFGNEEGIAEVAEEFRVRHVPDVLRTSSGTPLVSDLFKRAQQLSDRRFLCCINSDIILMSDFTLALQRVAARSDRFLLVGHRWNVEVTAALDFGGSWERDLRAHVAARGTLASPWSIDFFAFPRGVLGEIPPFAIGRPLWDNWMLYRARSLRMPLIDVTQVAMAVHQNHDYSHHPQGWEGTRYGEEALANERLAGDFSRTFTITDATHLLTHDRLRRPWDREHLLRLCETLPILYPWAPLRLLSKAVSVSRRVRSQFRLTLDALRYRLGS